MTILLTLITLALFASLILGMRISKKKTQLHTRARNAASFNRKDFDHLIK